MRRLVLVNIIILFDDDVTTKFANNVAKLISNFAVFTKTPDTNSIPDLSLNRGCPKSIE